MVFNNSKWYDIIKWAVITGLPAISAFIGTLGTIYGFNSEVIVLTINAVTVLIGALIGISGIRYQKSITDTNNEVG